MTSIMSNLRPRALGAALLGLVATLFALAAPSAASTYTLTYSGQVTNVTGVLFTTLGIGTGDTVSGSVGLENLDSYSSFVSGSVNNNTFNEFPMPTEFKVSHAGSTYTFDNPGVGNIVSQVLNAGTSSLALTSFGPVSKLSLYYETLTPNAPLTSLVGLTDWGQVPALLAGATASFFGKFEVNDLGSVTFAINLAPVVATTPIPAALPLFVSALGGFGLLGWRRRRGAAAA